MIVHVENTMESTQKTLLELINELARLLNTRSIYTNQLYIDKQYHNEVLAINFYADGELIASGKIKLI